MKTIKFFTAVVVVLMAMNVAQAQEFKPFQLYLGLGYAAPGDGGGGILIDLEPAYRLNDQIAIGLRLESAAMAKAVGEVEASVSAVGSYTVNGKYYLSDNNFRPYVGVGLGLYSLGSVDVDVVGASSSISAGTKFGFYPRIGFDLGHFNINFDYNIIPTTSNEVSVTVGGSTITSESDIKNSYFGIRIGAFIFGGRN